MFAGKKSAQIREILINESAWEEMTCLFALSLRKAVEDYIHYYNNERISLKLKGLSPVEYRTQALRAA
ncbi:IS3 family transposase [Klebsiella pneumoniae]|nr:IS3 family transposase [Klebsiella pneumoniae]MBK2960022.1 IS3 family transposase [Klebsiella pneumoniae]